MPTFAPLCGLAAVADQFEAVLSDVWGVVHDGQAAFPAAVDCLTRLRDRGAAVILLSNTPRPAPPIHKQLRGFGIEAGRHYDALVTAGDVARHLMIEKFSGARVFHVGTARDLPVFDQVPVTLVADLEQADVIVCTGFWDEDRETAKNYRPLLARAVARGLPFICANPDLIVHRGADVLPCAGAIAVLYEELGGVVHYCGKPHGPVYDRALRVASACLGRKLDRSRVLAIGDGLHTDIQGAKTYGLPALFIASGIHRDSWAEGTALEQAERAPDWVLERLVW